MGGGFMKPVPHTPVTMVALAVAFKQMYGSIKLLLFLEQHLKDI
jgi:hypothetical protein